MADTKAPRSSPNCMKDMAKSSVLYILLLGVVFSLVGLLYSLWVMDGINVEDIYMFIIFILAIAGIVIFGILLVMEWLKKCD